MADTLDELRIISLTGNLGYGFPEASLAEAMSRKPHYIGADNGSSDPGPYYLGAGTSLTRRDQVRRDLGLSLAAARELGVPYIIGTAGTAGGQPHLDYFLDILDEVTKRDGHSYRLATIGAEIDKETVKAAIRTGRVRSMGVLPELTEAVVDETVRIVGQMGTGPFVKALEQGAEVIIAGRACDTAIFTAAAQHHGFDLGLGFHMAKILECGAQCGIPLAANDCMMGTLRRDHFDLEPMNMASRVSTVSVAAHMMYEQPDPHHFYEPEGLVNLEGVELVQIDERRVRASGARLEPAQSHTIKLEGVRLRGYRAITIAGITDPLLIANLDAVEARTADTVEKLARGTIERDQYQLNFIYYGRNGVRPRKGPAAEELGIVIEAIAPSQELANMVLSLARSSFLHGYFPGRKATAGNLAFPFSPSDLAAGAVYDFSIYHVMEVDDSDSLFPVSIRDVA